MTGSPDPATVEMAYLILTPVWTNITLPVNTPADNAACTPGRVSGFGCQLSLHLHGLGHSKASGVEHLLMGDTDDL